MDYSRIKKYILVILLFVIVCPMQASDGEANNLFAEGRSKEKDGNYRKSAQKYMDARFMADSAVLKGNALIAAARAYRKAELYGDEFDCLQKLLLEHLNGIDFTQVVGRIYKIGDLYFAGHRDIFVTWLPFVKKDDRTIEIYEAALKHAPCFERAAETRLRLARIYIEDQKIDDAIRHLREVPKLHPNTASSKYARLELCSLLAQMSERGDGDSSYSRQAIQACDEFEQEFPEVKEIHWVRKTRETVRNRIAVRIHAIGNFYYRQGKPELAEKYLADVIRNYSNTEQAAKSEKLLAKIDSEFEAKSDPRRRFIPYKQPIKVIPIPEEDQPIMVVPEQSENRWLLPVRNLKKSPVVNPANVTADIQKIDFSEKGTEK